MTAHGEAQARAVGESLRERGAGAFDLVVSPPGRIRATAAIICRALGRDPGTMTTDMRIMEVPRGAWEAMTYIEIESRDPEPGTA